MVMYLASVQGRKEKKNDQSAWSYKKKNCKRAKKRKKMNLKNIEKNSSLYLSLYF